MSKIGVYVEEILMPVILGTIIGLITSSSMDYSMLNKPFLSPPGILFPIVWTILYILMGISYALLRTKNLTNKKIDFIYYLQLFVNLLWSIFFFVLKWRLFSIVWIVLLVVLVIIMIKEFFYKNKLSAILQLPYLLWLAFATYLNIAIYLLNR